MSYTDLNSASNSTFFKECEFEFDLMHQLTMAHNYSNIIWEGGVRKADNFIAAHSLILDFDGTWPLEAAKAEFQSVANACLVTSKSHQSEFKIDEFGQPGKAIVPRDYFHVIVGLPEPITSLDSFKTVMANLIAKYGSDPSCKDGARMYYGCPKQQFWYS